jgi:glyoxylase-like metal-dependent hydrolase (beta-lactamase superfamily II)
MRIHTLDLHFLQLPHVIAAFVVEGPQGLALVETGPASTLPAFEAALKAQGMAFGDFRHVFLSHIHFDHAGAAWLFAEKGAKIYVHPKGLPHMAAPEKLYNSARMIYGDQMDALWGPMHPIAEALLYAPEHGEKIEACGLTFTAWHTPGHAVHHIAWQAEAPGEKPVLFTGDVGGAQIDKGPVAPPCPPPDIDVEAWRASIQLMRELPAEILYLTHFGKIENKIAHLNALEQELLDFAVWMRPYAERQTPQEEIIPHFNRYVRERLTAAGLDAEGIRQYEAANPPYMSVAGLMRYWKKKIIS